MGSSSRRSLASAAILLTTIVLLVRPAAVDTELHHGRGWVGTWTASPQPASSPLPIDGQTPWGDTFRGWSGDVETSIHALEAEPDPVIPSIARTTATHITTMLPHGGMELATITMSLSFDVFEVSVDIPARVRLYKTAAQRDADAARPAGTLPTETSAEHGCFLEALFTTAGTFSVTTGGRGFLPSGNMVPIAVTNHSGALGMVVVTLTYLPLETP